MKKSFKMVSLLLLAVMMVFVMVSCDDDGKPLLKAGDNGDAGKGTVVIVLNSDAKNDCSAAGKVIFNWKTADVVKSPGLYDGIIDVTDQKDNTTIVVKLEPGDYSAANCQIFTYGDPNVTDLELYDYYYSVFLTDPVKAGQTVTVQLPD